MPWQRASETGYSTRWCTPHMPQCARTGQSEEYKALNETLNSETFAADAQTPLQWAKPSTGGSTCNELPRWSAQTLLTFRVQVDPTQISFRFLQKRQLWLIRPSICRLPVHLRPPSPWRWGNYWWRLDSLRQPQPDDKHLMLMGGREIRGRAAHQRSRPVKWGHRRISWVTGFGKKKKKWVASAWQEGNEFDLWIL